MSGARFRAASPEDRADAGAFVGRVARWDPATPVRLRADGDLVRIWAGTPFDALVTRAVAGSITPTDVTVYAGSLLAGLEVSVAEDVDPGTTADAAWRSQLPPAGGWVLVDRVPATVLAALAQEFTSGARDRPGPAGGASAALLDSEVMEVSGNGMRVPLTVRVLFALSGMGFAGPGEAEIVRISATDSWVRLDARYGAVLRRRHALIPLLL
ncbi:hypothetical protein JL107_12365 [Nakamurella flavida]|uniref:Uncharacterized protein n=1 Tax=Nakamurella flavida TaxID=363630 RepID=A0A939C104_9ACTN|nr:hypothetical protein [Nakamurella flavida]MBM9477238.1 hypothetical protein [Nakamurella flavida]MDP9776380.1 hypothetical protein [Nakamurella flavida]